MGWGPGSLPGMVSDLCARAGFGSDPGTDSMLGSSAKSHARVEAMSGPGSGAGGGAPGASGFLSPRPSSNAQSPQAPHVTDPFPLHRAITLENTLVILSTVAPDAGRYYVQAVNDKNGDNKTSQPITLAVESK